MSKLKEWQRLRDLDKWQRFDRQWQAMTQQQRIAEDNAAQWKRYFETGKGEPGK